MITRLLLGALGLGAIVWGAVSLLDDPGSALVSVAIWLAAGVLLHDAVLAPLTIGVLLLGRRVLPAAARGPAAVAFLVWATCTIAFSVVLSGQGGKPGNDTILDRDYALWWVVLTLLLAALAAVASVRRARSGLPTEPTGTP